MHFPKKPSQRQISKSKVKLRCRNVYMFGFCATYLSKETLNGHILLIQRKPYYAIVRVVCKSIVKMRVKYTEFLNQK